MKKLTILAMYLLLFHIFFPIHIVSAQTSDYASGNGTKDNPYLISKPAQLNAIRNNLSAHYKLINDIDLEYDTTNTKGLFYNDGKGFEPIGKDFEDFTGYLDGNGYKIKGLYINRGNENYIGLFGETRSAKIFNLILEGSNINGNFYVGSLVGNAIGSEIQEIVAIDGNVLGNGSHIGGIIGANQFGHIMKSYNSNTITTNSALSFGAGGGISGLNYFGIIEDVFNIGNINNLKNESNTGGIVGYHFGGSISNTYNLTKHFARTISGNVSNSYNLNDIDSELTHEGTNYINGGEENYLSSITLSTIDSLRKSLTYHFSSTNWIIKNNYLPRLKNLNYTEVESVGLSANNVTMTKIGLTKQLDIMVNPTNATNQNLIWSSSNEKVVTVIDGLITVIGYGKAVITVSSLDGSIASNCNVSVVLKGDINEDGKVTLTDLTKLRRYLVGLDTNNDNSLSTMDINEDGKVTLTDLTKLRRYLAGLEVI